MEEICETCAHDLGKTDRGGRYCGGGYCDSEYSGWKPKTAPEPKDVNMAAVQNDLLKFSDICLGACSDKRCSTCRHVGDLFSDRCSSVCVNYSLWEPKESGIHAARGDIDRTFTAFTDKLKGCNPETTLTDTQKKISEICDEIKNILLEKNRKYGDSALNPKRVFSKASPIEQINVRIDDKISRIMSAQDDDTEDAELDLIGYLILKRVAKKVLHDVQ